VQLILNTSKLNKLPEAIRKAASNSWKICLKVFENSRVPAETGAK
jgi:hypothetical protein